MLCRYKDVRSSRVLLTLDLPELPREGSIMTIFDVGRQVVGFEELNGVDIVLVKRAETCADTARRLGNDWEW